MIIQLIKDYIIFYNRNIIIYSYKIYCCESLILDTKIWKFEDFIILYFLSS